MAGTLPKVTPADILLRPELYGKVEGFRGVVTEWHSAEDAAISRYIGKSYEDLEDGPRLSYNIALVKLVYWNWVWPESKIVRSEVFDTIRYIRDLDETDEDDLFLIRPKNEC